MSNIGLFNIEVISIAWCVQFWYIYVMVCSLVLVSSFYVVRCQTLNSFLGFFVRD